MVQLVSLDARARITLHASLVMPKNIGELLFSAQTKTASAGETERKRASLDS
jgi:hypothetical protein